MTILALSTPSFSSALRGWFARYGAGLARRSEHVVMFFSLRMGRIAALWIAAASLLAAFKLFAPLTPVHDAADFAALALPYAAIILAPIAGYWAAAGSFPRGFLSAQPRFRIAIYGRWQRISVIEAWKDPRFGPTGFMASLLIGLMLNVPVRLLEFVAAVPAMNANSPVWGQTLFLTMAAEVCVMSFLYMACFVMALRKIPLFPRMLAAVWLLDVLAQFTIAEIVTRTPNLPFAVADALHQLLEGNIKKVLVSVFVWLPYLLLSDRVNITYRNRAPEVVSPA